MLTLYKAFKAKNPKLLILGIGLTIIQLIGLILSLTTIKIIKAFW